MIDLHLHLLPGIDDGAGDLDEAEAMCQAAARDGCHTLIATPHQRTDWWENRDQEGRVTDLVTRVREVAPDGLEILSGAEIHVDSEFLAELRAPAASGLLPLAGLAAARARPGRGRPGSRPGSPTSSCWRAGIRSSPIRS